MYIGHPNYIYKQLEASDLKDGLVFMLQPPRNIYLLYDSSEIKHTWN